MYPGTLGVLTTVPVHPRGNFIAFSRALFLFDKKEEKLISAESWIRQTLYDHARNVYSSDTAPHIHNRYTGYISSVFGLVSFAYVCV